MLFSCALNPHGEDPSNDGASGQAPALPTFGAPPMGEPGGPNATGTTPPDEAQPTSSASSPAAVTTPTSNEPPPTMSAPEPPVGSATTSEEGNTDGADDEDETSASATDSAEPTVGAGGSGPGGAFGGADAGAVEPLDGGESDLEYTEIDSGVARDASTAARQASGR